ncbi:MAG: hypothetical protein LQ343_003519 [Gyalolechia ehrenbergii]|nr:MAG: hypothetical protein LQ343_003519 [Gyalolechia ehrenbergii]
MSAVFSGLALDKVLTREPPIPPIPQYEVSFHFDYKIKLGVIDVYQTAIQMMYDLAQRSYVQTVHAVDSKQFGNYNVLILFINIQSPSAPEQLQIMHCVSTLYRAIQIVTDGVLFFQNRAALMLQHKHIGGMSMTPIDAAAAMTDRNDSSADSIEEDESSGSNSASDDNVLHWSRGHIKDRVNPQFSIDFQFLGKSINTKEVSMAVLEALTVAAPHPKDAGCEDISVASPDGGCAIIVESIPSVHHFTYQWATRALILLYQEIVVAQRKFGDVKLDLRYDGQIFGELRMLKTTGDKNNTEFIASER